MIVVALGLYLWGVRRNNALHPRHRWPVGKTIAWVGALLTTGIAIFSFVGVYDGELFWDHMVQHLILIMVAAPLFAVASPLRLAFNSTSGTAHIVVTEALALARRQVPRQPDRRLHPLRRRHPGQPPDGLVQLHAHAGERAQRGAPDLPARGLPVLAADLRERPQRAPAPPGPAVLLPLHGHPDRHLHRAVAGRCQPRAVPRLLRHPPDLGPVPHHRPPRGRRHHVGRGRHPHAVADDPGRPALDAHGRAQSGCASTGSWTSGRPRRPRPRARCPISRRGPSAPRGPRRGRCSRRTRGRSRRSRWSSDSTRRWRRRAPPSGPPCRPRRARGRRGGSARAG